MKALIIIGICALSTPRLVQGQTATNDFYEAPAGSALNVSAPGVLANDSGANLKATLVTGPANGTLTLNPNGAFVYTSTNNFTGVDGFTYQASNGSQTSSVATAVISVVAPGELFYDNFLRPTNTSPIFPWVTVTDGAFVLGNWSISNQLMFGTSPFDSYGYTYYQNAGWTDYSVQAQLQFSSINAASAGILGRLNPVTGAHYAVWIYPEGSSEQYSPQNGTAVLLLIKYSNWTNYTVMGYTNTLPGIGTSWHTLNLQFQSNNIATYFDGVLVTNITDDGSIDGQPAYTSGGIGLNLWTLAPYPYTLSVDNVIVNTNVCVANYDAFNATNNVALQVPAPGILANDSGNGPLTALLVSNPAGGSLTLTNNGGFIYTPTNGFISSDSFTYQCTDGQTTSSVATVFITLNDTLIANNDFYSLTANTTLSVGQPGVLANAAGGNAPLTAALAGSTAKGNLTLTNNGGFSYSPTNNFTGLDSFTYLATDGHGTSSVATAEIMVLPSGALFSDNFTRPPSNNSIFPWVNELGAWGITNHLLIGTSDFNNYGYAYYENVNWTNYSIQAQIRYSSTNAWGGAIGGRLDPSTGARYDVWIYPEGSPWGLQNGSPAGVATLQIIKYESWTAYTAGSLVRLSGVGTNWHTVKLAVQGNNIFAYFDGKQVTNVVDNGSFDGQPAFTNGGISLDMWTASPTAYTFSVSNVLVTALTVTTSSLPNGTNFMAYSQQLNASGGQPPYNWTNIVGALPPGLSLATNGVISGTPTTNGTFNFTVQVTDALSATAAFALALTINLAKTTNPPVLLISSPTSGQRWSNAVFTVSGTASDKLAVSGVFDSLNGSAWTPATTGNNWSNWTAGVTLTPGTNVVRAYAVDTSDNVSATNQVSFDFVVTNQLQLQTIGLGTVSPNYSNSWLEVGRNYTLTATPAAGFVFTNWSGGTNLPFTVITNKATVQFQMASNLVLQANYLDTNRPTLTIASPLNGQRWSNQVFTAKGTATDNWQVAGVQYQLNGRKWTNATGTTNWTAALNLIPGTNLLQACAVDSSGNKSPTNTVRFDFVVTNQLQVRATGLGAISPNYSNAWLEVGRNYSITSAPANGFVLTNWIISTNWIGGVTSTNATVQFLMASNLALQVNFLDVSRPTLTITTPAAGQHMSNALTTITGTASDNWAVTGVWCQLNSNAWTAATSTNKWTNWMSVFPLVAGTNTVKAYAVDSSGNLSPTRSVSVLSSNTFKLLLNLTNSQPLAGKGLGFTLQLSPGLNGRIQVSTNLTSWATLTNFVGTNATVSFRDPAATNSNRRFYRAVIP